MKDKMSGKRGRALKYLATLICLLAVTALGECSWLRDVVGTVAALSVSTGESSGRFDTGLMKVHFIDVGQGDSQLIECDGHYMLVDAGEVDEGRKVVRYLKSLGVEKLDYIIGTHPHSDHIGGMATVVNAFDVGTVLIPPVENTIQCFEDFLDAVEDKGLKLTRPEAGAVYELGGASYEIVSPVGDYGDDLNDWSIGIRLTYKNNHVLMCGDAQWQSEHDMIASGMDLGADILKASHHGSSTSSGEEFLDKVKPSYVVISCEKYNPYGHPHKEVMAALSDRNIQVFRTDRDGTVTAVCDGDAIAWMTAAGGQTGLGTGSSDPDRPGGTDRSWEAQEETEAAGAASSPAEVSTPEAEEEISYVLNTKSKKIHLPFCPSVETIKPKNKKEYAGDREELLEEGYSPCGNCKP